jgi:hypothetical protein
MDRLVSIPKRDSSKLDGEEVAYASKFRRIYFNPLKGFSLLVADHSKSPSYFSLPASTQF